MTRIAAALPPPLPLAAPFAAGPAGASAFAALLMPAGEAERHDDAAPGKDVPAGEAVATAPPMFAPFATVPPVMPVPTGDAAAPAGGVSALSNDISVGDANPTRQLIPDPAGNSATGDVIARTAGTVLSLPNQQVGVGLESTSGTLPHQPRNAPVPAGSTTPVLQARHPSGGWGPSLAMVPPASDADPSLRRDDGVSAANGSPLTPVAPAPLTGEAGAATILTGVAPAPASRAPVTPSAAMPLTRTVLGSTTPGDDTPRVANTATVPLPPPAMPVPAAQPPAALPPTDLAARTFADARHRAVTEDRTADPLLPATAAITAQAVAAPVQAAQQAPLDLTQHRWPEAMIERIEVLRDLADANDLSIRLAPDALGTIDVSLKRDGDAVQVQLTAEHAHTRQLLADAQPKLTELAAERGVRLQHAGTDAQGGDPRRAPPSAPGLPTTPAPATRGEEAVSTDTRIA